MLPRHAIAAALTALAITGGCGSSAEDQDSAGVDTQEDGSPDDAAQAEIGDDGSTNDAEQPDTGDGGAGGGGGAETTTPRAVGSVIQGTAVAGNAGGQNDETEPYSQTVRHGDRTCEGWAPENNEPWTEGLAAGASVTILDESGAEIGSGIVESSAAYPLDGDDTGGQWTCEFAITATVSSTPETFTVQVAGLPPWPAGPDPDDPERFRVQVITPEYVPPPDGGGSTTPSVPPTDSTTLSPPSTLTP